MDSKRCRRRSDLTGKVPTDRWFFPLCWCYMYGKSPQDSKTRSVLLDTMS